MKSKIFEVKEMGNIPYLYISVSHKARAPTGALRNTGEFYFPNDTELKNKAPWYEFHHLKNHVKCLRTPTKQQSPLAPRYFSIKKSIFLTFEVIFRIKQNKSLTFQSKNVNWS